MRGCSPFQSLTQTLTMGLLDASGFVAVDLSNFGSSVTFEFAPAIWDFFLFFLPKQQTLWPLKKNKFIVAEGTNDLILNRIVKTRSRRRKQNPILDPRKTFDIVISACRVWEKVRNSSDNCCCMNSCGKCQKVSEWSTVVNNNCVVFW